METPTGICNGCQTIIDEMASLESDDLVRNFEPAFISRAPGAAPCSLCLLLEGTAKADGYSASHECLREAFTRARKAIYFYLAWRYMWLSLRPLEEHLEEHGAGGSPRTSSNHTGSLESLAFARSKLDDCVQHHQCSFSSKNAHQEGGWWPTRLLDLGISPTENIRLINPPPQKSTESYQYAVLSYPWGGKTFKALTVESEPSCRAGIPLAELPSTFRDAVAATRALGLRYLWIDALCIIQGSADDWQREAPRMALVYGNSQVNLAATASMDPEGGLFRERHPVMVNGCRGIFPQGGKTEHICVPEDDWLVMVERATLNERGWVFQERLLAPRTLHFATTQIFWECTEAMASEQFPSAIPRKQRDRIYYNAPSKASLQQLRKSHTSPHLVYSLWYEILETYSNMEFTVNDDRLVAFSGIVEVFQEALPRDARYLAGLWEAHLPWNLLWLGDARGSSRPIQDRAKPSWSWASALGSDGGAHVNNLRYFDMQPQSAKASVLDVKVTPVNNPLGTVREATLGIQARMCRVVVVQPESGDDPFERLEINGREVSGAHIALSTPMPSSEGAVLLEVFDRGEGQTAPLNYNSILIAGLILSPTGKQGTYYRVGVYHVDNWEHYTEQQRQATLHAFRRGFTNWDLTPSQYKEFDGKGRYVVEII